MHKMFPFVLKKKKKDTVDNVISGEWEWVSGMVGKLCPLLLMYCLNF